MKQIIFATGNSGKVATLQHHIDSLGVDVQIVQKSLELLEPQADTVQEVAKVKAQQAYQQLGQPVLVDDSSFHIAALGGFPGPYIKYMLTTIGVTGIIDFMHGKADRNAHFLSSLVYIDEKGSEHVFNDSPYEGIITEVIDDFDSETAWSDLYKVFIPKGGDKVLARMTHEDHAQLKSERVDAYALFCEWLKNVEQDE